MLVERSGLGQVMTGSPQVCTTPQCQADLAAINGQQPATNSPAAIQNSVNLAFTSPESLMLLGLGLGIFLLAPSTFKPLGIVPIAFDLLILRLGTGGL